MTPLQAAPVKVTAAGKGWLAVDKPAGLAVHNDPGHDLRSLLTRFFETDLRAAAQLVFDPGFGLHPVHRLDRDTSGLILLACRRDVFGALSLQFSRGDIHKEYLALVHGRVEPPCEGRWAEWNFDLTKTAGGRSNIQGSGQRLPCLTRYRVVRRGQRYSLLRCHLVTGRKHQIRRHAALDGHPVLGDRRYGPARACRYLARQHHFTRLGLHASLIKFQPPESDTISVLEASCLPEAIETLIAMDCKKTSPANRIGNDEP